MLVAICRVTPTTCQTFFLALMSSSWKPARAQWLISDFKVAWQSTSHVSSSELSTNGFGTKRRNTRVIVQLTYYASSHFRRRQCSFRWSQIFSNVFQADYEIRKWGLVAIVSCNYNCNLLSICFQLVVREASALTVRAAFYVTAERETYRSGHKRKLPPIYLECLAEVLRASEDQGSSGKRRPVSSPINCNTAGMFRAWKYEFLTKRWKVYPLYNC